MTITLHVISYKNHTPANELSVTIDEAACSIGRSKKNDFVLPDVERIISHRHASIHFDNGNYYLTDNSTNGTFINHASEPIGQGNTILLHDGDILSIGEYDCAVFMVMQQEPATDSLKDEAIWQPPVQQAAPVKQPSWEKEAYHEPAAPIAPMPTLASAEPAAEQAFFRPPEAIPEDWDILSGEELQQQEAAPIIPDMDIAVAPPPVKQKKRPLKPGVKVKSAPDKTTDLDQQAVNAFLNGAGLTQVQIEPQMILSFMNNAGQLVREITNGFKHVLDTRSSLKSEFRLGMTTIRPSQNNPLKFSIDIEDALTKLLLPPAKGYLPAIEAVHEATDDLQAHQMALLAGLRAALSSLVALFDPEMLEKEFQKASALDNLLPYIKQAKYWELFKTRYRQAAADAENDFLHFLGDEFSKAYEQQIQRLKSARSRQ